MFSLYIWFSWFYFSCTWHVIQVVKHGKNIHCSSLELASVSWTITISDASFPCVILLVLNHFYQFMKWYSSGLRYSYLYKVWCLLQMILNEQNFLTKVLIQQGLETPWIFLIWEEWALKSSTSRSYIHDFRNLDIMYLDLLCSWMSGISLLLESVSFERKHAWKVDNFTLLYTIYNNTIHYNPCSFCLFLLREMFYVCMQH